MNPEHNDQDEDSGEVMDLGKIANKFVSHHETTYTSIPAIPDYKYDYILEFLRDKGWLPRIMEKEKKSNTSSAESRAEGNICYARKDTLRAFTMYSRAISEAPLESEEIALAFANRSAVAYDCKKYVDAVNDINKALSHAKYPDHLKHKLYKRRGHCYRALELYSKALDDFESSKAVLQVDSSDYYTRTVLEIENLIETCRNKSDKPEPETSEDAIRLSHGVSPCIPSASAALDIRFSPEYGRHIVANRDILPGDVVAIDKFYVSVLKPEQDWEYVICNNCKKYCFSMVPCFSCNVAMFCSEDCRLSSWEAYHSIECDILPTLNAIATEEEVIWKTLVALRILLVASKCGKDFEALMKPRDVPESPELSGFVNGKYLSDHYTPIHHLSTNLERRTSMDVTSLMVYATCLVHLLKEETKFFENCLLSVPNWEDAFASSKGPLDAAVFDLLFRYEMIAAVNAFYLTDVIQTGGTGFTGGKDYGAGVFPFVSLVSHSCDPNVSHFIREGFFIMIAIQPIRKGEQLFEDYGYNFHTDRRHDRQVLLERHYHFTCKCPACVYNWPLFNFLPTTPVFKRTSTDRSVLRLADGIERMASDVSRGLATERHWQLIRDFMFLAHENVELPWKTFSLCQDALKCFIVRKTFPEKFQPV